MDILGTHLPEGVAICPDAAMDVSFAVVMSGAVSQSESRGNRSLGSTLRFI